MHIQTSDTTIQGFHDLPPCRKTVIAESHRYLMEWGDHPPQIEIVAFGANRELLPDNLREIFRRCIASTGRVGQTTPWVLGDKEILWA
jgi:hypothetical protein